MLASAVRPYNTVFAAPNTMTLPKKESFIDIAIWFADTFILEHLSANQLVMYLVAITIT